MAVKHAEVSETKTSRAIDWTLLAEATLLALMVVFAAYLRLNRLELSEFKFDEAAALVLAQDIVLGKELPLVGLQSSVGVYNPPFLPYLMTIPRFISSDPAIATGFVASLNILAVILCYGLVRQYFGRREAIIACALYVSSFWATMYSRKIWGQDLLPPFTLVFFITLFAAFVGQRPTALIAAFFCLGLLVQLHLSALALVVLMVFAILLFHRQVRWWALLAGILAFIAPLAPYLYWEATNDFFDWKMIPSLVGGETQWDVSPLLYLFKLMGASDFEAVLGYLPSSLYPAWRQSQWLEMILSAILGVGLLYLFLSLVIPQMRRDQARLRGYTLLCLWLVIPCLAFLRHSWPLHPYYLLILYPGQFIVAGIIVVKSINALGKTPYLGRILSGLAYGLTGAFLIAQGWFQGYLFNQVMEFIDQAPTLNSYGIPLKHMQTIVRTVKGLKETPEKRVGIIVLENQCEVFRYLFQQAPITCTTDYGRTMVFPGDQRSFLFITEGEDTQAYLFLYNNIPGSKIGAIKYQTGDEIYQVHRVSEEQLQQAFHIFRPLHHQLDFGIRLDGYTMTEKVGAGESIMMTLYWSITKGREAKSDYRFFNHLVDAKGQKWGQVDWIGYPSSEWQKGDRVITWHEVPVRSDAPAGEYWLDIGLYDLASRARSPVRDLGGDHTSDFVRLGPLKVTNK